MQNPISYRVAAFLMALAPALAQPAHTPAEEIRSNFADVNRKVLDMARDFPEDKYNFRLRPEMRTFGAVIVHIASGNVYAARAGRGEKVKWDELDSTKYKDKASIVALFQKASEDAMTTLKGVSEAHFSKTLDPWLSVMEHSAEHYGLLVAYYRANGLVPPESRPKK